ncbi:glycerophosphoryl diester phosphodiesterase membrane domain-containing protein [Herbiconiux moechotypicola]|uniref:DUF7847 domain-containing protein n=1 Tax=Herbiconiux moechotypicola TaxID=637393 RepID=A0ABN3DV59_9MICO|nr:glycerophosphoryl diester phosphodiesterase membrane domain-containing protein [Herbiconiux moechotypicola]MCS5731046.1 glycerophosphoryl diester phosphodiesterase membrane domain-containing protein [Herbiconiux moechotypicola]
MDDEKWTAPDAATPPPAAPAPQAPAVPPVPAAGQYPPPQLPPVPQYGQYAPPQAPQYGQYAPPQAPQYGQYAPPQATQYAPPPPPQHGWTPPPKPGLIPLRPLGFGTLLGAPFQVVRRNPKATFGSGLIVQLVIVVVTVLFVGAAALWAGERAVRASGSDAAAIEAGNVAIVLVSLLVPLVLTLFGTALLQAVLVVEVARGTLGEKRRLGELWKAAFRRVLPLTGWFALTVLALLVAVALGVAVIAIGAAVGGAALGVGILVAVLLGLAVTVLFVWLGTKLALVPSVIVLERRGVIASMRRSWSLTSGHFWRTFGVIALVYAIVSIATQILSTPISFLFPLVITLVDPNNSGSGVVAIIVLYVVFAAFSIVLGALTSVIQSATVAVVYIDLRMRKEGLDIELVRYAEAATAPDSDGQTAWPDPYAPSPRG